MTRFAQQVLLTTALSTVAVSPVLAASPDDSRIAGAGSTIFDNTGARWTMDNTGHVYVNGVRDPHAYNVRDLCFEDGRVWQENSSYLWWYRTKPSDSWLPSNGTQKAPTPPVTAQLVSGSLAVRVAPNAVVLVTGVGSGGVILGQHSYQTGPLGTLSIPQASLYGHGTYTVSEMNKRVIAMAGGVSFLSDEVHYAYDYLPYDLQVTFGASASLQDWTKISALSSADAGSFTLLTYAIGAYPVYVTWNGSQTNQYGLNYIVRNSATSTTIANLQNKLFLDVDQVGSAHVLLNVVGTTSYTKYVVGSTTIGL